MIAKEIEREGIPVALISAMTMVGKQTRANRIITGTNIPHPCGDPSFPPKADRTLRKEIIKCALNAIQTDVDGPTIFEPEVTFSAR